MGSSYGGNGLPAIFDENGNISEYQSVGRNVTQHREAMEKSQNNIKTRTFFKKKKIMN